MRKEIEEVFTPRSSEINTSMYIDRTEYEDELKQVTNGTFNPVLFGESGCGKTWLYQKAYNDAGVKYFIANCAKASINKSIIEELKNIAYPTDQYTVKALRSTTGGEINGLVLKGSEEVEVEIEHIKADPLLAIYKKLHSLGNNNKHIVIVLDNLEAIIKNKALMKELGDLIILTDDPKYSKFKVKYLIVGTPQHIIDYYRNVEQNESVSNRLSEIKKVGSIKFEGIRRFVEKGFYEKLDIPLTRSKIDLLAKHIYFITLGIPQRIQEYCYYLAYEIKKNRWEYDPAMHEEANLKWILMKLRQPYSIIEKAMNNSDLKVARRNQVVYCIGQLTSYAFDKKRIEELIREEFPLSSRDKVINVSKILNDLAEMEKPIIRATEKSGKYEIVDPRYLITIRVVIKKLGTEKVILKKFGV